MANRTLILTVSSLVLIFCMTSCDKHQRVHEVHGQTLPPKEKRDVGGAFAPPVNDEINAMIEIASAILVDENSNRAEYIERVCSRIDALSDEQARRRAFKRLCNSAFSIQFDGIGNVQANNENERWEINRRLGLAYASLEKLVDEVQIRMMQNRASPREQFEPMFRYYEKMREEAMRTGERANRGYPGKLKDIERMYGLCLKMSNSSSNDFAWVRERFLQLVGRPIRTLEEVEADRRVEQAKAEALVDEKPKE